MSLCRITLVEGREAGADASSFPFSTLQIKDLVFPPKQLILSESQLALHDGTDPKYPLWLGIDGEGEPAQTRRGSGSFEATLADLEPVAMQCTTYHRAQRRMDPVAAITSSLDVMCRELT